MNERDESMQSDDPGDDGLAWIEEEYQELVPKLEAEMDLERWQKRRRELLKVLMRRRRLQRDFARRASQLSALMLARGEAPEKIIWEESIGRIAYGEMLLRLELYRADIHIQHLRTPGSRLRLQRWVGMEEGAYAAFMEAREVAVKRLRELELDDPLLDCLAGDERGQIVNGEDENVGL